MADLYKVVIKGKPILGWARAEVIANLAKLMKISPDKATELLQAEPMTVKQNIEHFQAEKLVRIFRDAGVDTEMVRLAAAVPRNKPRRPADEMACPKCGHLQQSGLEECGGCGVLFAKLAAMAEAERQAKASAAAAKPHFMEDLAAFIGPKQEYYIPQVERFRQRQGGFVWTWNWGAFLGAFWWLLYRKMPAAAAAAVIGLCLPGVQLLVWIALGGFANYLYFQHAKKKIGRMRAVQPTGDIRPGLAAAGGIDRRIPVLAIAVTLIMVALATAVPFYMHYHVARQLDIIPRTALLQPTFQTAEGFKVAGGTACVVEIPEYERFMLVTVHHLFGPMGGFEKAYAWDEMRALIQQVNATTPVNMSLVISTREVLQIPGAAVFSGQNVNRDLAVFPLPDRPAVPVFRLSGALPEPGTRLWLMAFSGQGADAKAALHEARVITAGAEAVILVFSDGDLDLTGASGAPVIDGSGTLAGLLVAGALQDGMLYGFVNPAGDIRRLIEEGFKR